MKDPEFVPLNFGCSREYVQSQVRVSSVVTSISVSYSLPSLTSPAGTGMQ